MKGKRFKEAQIIRLLQETESGLTVAEGRPRITAMCGKSGGCSRMAGVLKWLPIDSQL